MNNVGVAVDENIVGLRAEAKDLAHLSEARHLRYCLLHGWPPVERTRSDLDIAIAPNDLARLEEILRNRPGGRVVQLLQHESSCYYFVLAMRHGTTAQLVALDAAVDYRRDGCIFFTANELLAGRRPLDDLWVAAPVTEFAYLLVKKFSKGALPEHQKARLRFLSRSLGGRALASAQRIFGGVWGDRVISWIDRSDWVALEACLPRLQRTLRWRVFARSPLTPLHYWWPELKRRWRRWRHPTGLWVAVLGSDGAGKTTFISGLQPHIAGTFRRTAAFHLYPTLSEQGNIRPAVTDPHGKAPHPFWLSWLKIPYYAAVYGFGYLFGVRPRLTRSTLVLFDRYYDDLLVDPRRYRYGGSMKLARFGRRLIPTPDLCFILDVPQEQLLQRKREVSGEELKRQRNAYRRLAAGLPGAVLMDGSLPAEEVARQGADVILEHLHQRYMSRRSLWFPPSANEVLDWLSSIVSSSGDQGHFVLSRPRQHHTVPNGTTGRTFACLSLRDGRGYLIPLESRRASIKALDLYNTQSRKARIAKALLAAGLQLGIGSRLLPRVKFVGHQAFSDGPESNAPFLEHLERTLGREGLSVALSFGTPGPHRKPVLLVLSREGETLAYVKLGADDVTNALVEHEAEVLKRLARGAFRSFTTPRVLHSGWWNGRYVSIQSSPARSTGPAPLDLNRQYLDVTRELAASHTEWLTLTEADLWKSILERIESISNVWYRHALERGLRRAEDWARAARLPFHAGHGDFAPWNAKRGGERLFVFDWEYATETGVAAGDVFHFLFQTMRLLQKRGPTEILDAFLAEGALRARVERFLTDLRLNDVPQELCLLLYCLQRFSNGAAGGSGDPAVQQELRSFANWLHTL